METGFTQVPNWALARCKTPYQLAVYLVLSKYADNEARTCYPSYKTIAKDAGCSRPTAVKAVSELETLNLIHSSERWDDKGDRTSNLYKLWSEPPDHQRGGKGDLPQVVKEIDCNYTHRNGTPTLEASDVLSEEDIAKYYASKTPTQRTNQ